MKNLKAYKVMRHIKGVEVVSFYISSRQKTTTS